MSSDAQSMIWLNLSTWGRPTGSQLSCYATAKGLRSYIVCSGGNGQASLDGRRVSLITFGSAVVPIHVLEYVNGSSTLRRVRSTVVSLVALAALLVGAVLLLHAGFLADTPWWLWLIAVVGMTLATLVIAEDSACVDQSDPDQAAEVTARAREKRDEVDIDELEHSLAGRAYGDSSRRIVTQLRKRCPEPFIAGLNATPAGLRWVDLWAPWDPVPNGPMLLAQPRAIPISNAAGRYRTLRPQYRTSGVVLPEAYVVSNRHQPWEDHTVHQINREDVAGRFAMEIAAAARDPVPLAVSQFEHRLQAPSEDGDPPQLVNPAAETGRRHRQWRGWAVFGAQIATIVLGIIAVTMRHERLSELGVWFVGALPDFLVTAVGGIVDVIPDQLKDLVAGGVRDSFHAYGLLTALAVIALVVLGEAAVVRSWQARASRRFADGDRADRVVSFGIPIAVLFVLTLLPLAATRVFDERDRPPVVSVLVEVEWVAADATVRTPVAAEVTFQPIGRNVDEAVVVDVPDEEIEVRLPVDRTYVINVTPHGGKDCVSQVPEGTEDQIRVICMPTSDFIEPRAPGDG